jgi:hypothetical protein
VKFYDTNIICLYEGLSGSQAATTNPGQPFRAAKTVWSTAATTFAGGRRLFEEEMLQGLPMERGLYAADGNAPNWCNFQGVTCGFSTSSDGTTVTGNSYVVTDIDISNLGLTGSLPSNIGNMKFLQTLLLNSNSLTGTIPTTIGSAYLTFQTMNLDNNKFRGPLPSQIGELIDLKTLTLNSNSLTGTIPTSMSLLTSFKAQNNILTGDRIEPTPLDVANSKFPASLGTAGRLNLDNNCLIFSSATYNVVDATSCTPTSQPSMRKFYFK